MADEHGHTWERWGRCARCHVDHGDAAAREACPGRPPVAPYGPSRRRRRIEDLALIDYVLRCSEHMGGAVRLHDAPIVLDAFQQGVEPDEIDWPVDGGYVHNPNCGGTCGDRCNG